jgi:WD40 repeat protein
MAERDERSTWDETDPRGDDAEDPADGEDQPRYRIGRVLGRGGSAVVRAAWDRELQREIAVKIMRQEGAGARARFTAEARITARLEHPNIVPVHDFGHLPDGVPYLSMKRVQGRSLYDVVRDGELSLERRLDLFRRVCDAVAFAHARGVLHRDLKSSNVMVGAFGEVLLMDWGLARPMRAGPEAREGSGDPPPSPRPFATQAGAVVGTPAYMPPEQAAGRLEELDERSDVYSLGAILYELLTGRPPLSGEVREVLAKVRAGAIPRPSAVARVPRELEAVVRMAMALRPEDRHPSAVALRDDVEAWLEHRPLPHARSSLAERLSKWTVRHRNAVQVGVSVGAVAAVVLLAGLWRYGADVGEARDAALAESQRARSAEVAARDALVEARIALADAQWSQGQVRDSWATLREATAETTSDPRPLELALSQQTAWSPPPVAGCVPHGSAPVLALALADAGDRALSWGGDGRLVAWDLASCEVLEERRVTGAPGPGAVSLEGGRARAAVIAGERLHVLELGVGGGLELPVEAGVHALTLEADAGWLAWPDGTGRGFDLLTGALGPVEGTRGEGWWRPDAGGRLHLATSGPIGSEQGGAWERDTGRALWTAWGVNAADATADGGLLLWGSADELGLVDLARGEPRWTVEHGAVLTLAIDATERAAWVVGFDGSLELWDLLAGTPIVTFAWDASGGLPRGDEAGPRTVTAGTPGARLVAVGGEEGVVSTFLRPLVSPRRPLRDDPGATVTAQGLAVHPGGRLVALGTEAGELILLDLGTGLVLQRWQVNEAGLRQLAFSPDGRSLAAAIRHDGVAVFDLVEGREALRVPLEVRSVSLAWTPSGAVAIGDADGQVLILDPRTGALRSLGRVVAAGLWDVTPLGGDRVLVGAHLGEELGLRVVDLHRGVVEAIEMDQALYHCDLSPDGALIACGRHDGTIWLRPLSGGQPWLLEADDGPTLGVAFSPDGSLLASTGFSRQVRVWDVASRRLLRSVRQHAGPGLCVAWTPDGGTVLSTGTDGLASLPLDAHRRHAEAMAATEATGRRRALGFARLGWWERVLPELELAGVDDPVLRWSARSVLEVEAPEAAQALRAELTRRVPSGE